MAKTKKQRFREHHIALYGGKSIAIDYGDKQQFARACQRVHYNAGEGFVVTPENDVYAITRSSKRAKLVLGDERQAVLGQLEAVAIA